MTFVLSTTSRSRLQGVHPKLSEVIARAIEISTVDFMVVEGVRSDEQCYINFGKGRTAAECVAKGCPAKYAQPKLAKVTWLGHPLSSNHRVKPDGLGHAVDLAPIVNGTVDWKNIAHFQAVAHAMMEAAKELKVNVVWGGSWKKSPDMPHFELV